MNLFAILLYSALAFLAYILYKNLLIPWLTRRRFNKQGIPTIPGCNPLLGHLPMFASMMKERKKDPTKNRPHVFTEMCKTHLPELEK